MLELSITIEIDTYNKFLKDVDQLELMNTNILYTQYRYLHICVCSEVKFKEMGMTRVSYLNCVESPEKYL